MMTTVFLVDPLLALKFFWKWPIQFPLMGILEEFIGVFRKEATAISHEWKKLTPGKERCLWQQFKTRVFFNIKRGGVKSSTRRRSHITHHTLSIPTAAFNWLLDLVGRVLGSQGRGRWTCHNDPFRDLESQRVRTGEKGTGMRRCRDMYSRIIQDSDESCDGCLHS